MIQELSDIQKKQLWSLLSQISMSDLVSEFKLPKQIGKNWLSDCPFCNTKTTFLISDAHSICKCMNCKKSFGKIDFIMTVKNIQIHEIADYLKSIL